MSFSDTYVESIQTKHVANVGFTSTAKGVTNEGNALVNPHQVIASQIPATDVVGTYGPLVADGMAASLVEKHTVKLTADPTVNGNKAWFATENNCSTPGHSTRGTVRVNQWMRFAETQYKLRLFEDTGAGAPDYTSEILPSEVSFNWEYDASAGLVYFDADPSAFSKTLPLWGELYTYVGPSVEDSLNATSSGIITVHNDLTDRDAASAHPASALTTTVASFNGKLSASDDTVQKALDTLDDHLHDDRYYTETEVDTLLTTLSGNLSDQLESKDSFLELNDTIDTYTAGRLLFESSTAVIDDVALTYNNGTQTLNVVNLAATGNISIDGYDVNEFVTVVSNSSTDVQVPTAGAVYDIVNTTSGTLQGNLDDLNTSLTDAIIWEVVNTPFDQIRPKAAHQGKAIYTAGNLTIGGDLTVSGTTTTIHSQELAVTDKMITVNNGEVGAGITGGSFAGIEVDRGSETNYMFVFDEVQDNFRVGISGSLQAVATREDAPTDGYVAVWNNAAVRFDTSASIALSDLATDAELAAVSGTLQTQIDNIDTVVAANFYTKTELDGGQLDNRYYTETEINGIVSTLSGTLQGEIDAVELDLDNNYYTKVETDALISSKDSFLELNDTIDSYNAGRVLFTTASGVVDSSTFTFAAGVLSTPAIDLEFGSSVNEIVTTITSGTTNSQLPTAKAVWDLTEAAAAAVHSHFDVDAVFASSTTWTYGSGFTVVPDALVIYVNGMKNRAGSGNDYVASIVGGVLTITFNYNVASDFWVNINYTA